MTSVQIALIDQTKSLDPGLLHAAATALTTQVSQHLPGVWPGISASVSYVTALKHLPHNVWPVFLVDQLPPGEGGFHLDKNHQPFAKVIASAGDQSWTIDASHEIIEMLIDPYGNKMQTAPAIAVSGNDVVVVPGDYQYLVEACDPCEANGYAYEIAGIAVSDFITPNFYDASASTTHAYSYRGNLKRPLQIHENNAWQQILWVDPNSGPVVKNLGALSALNFREGIHQEMARNETDAKIRSAKARGTLKAEVQTRVAHSQKLRTASAYTSHEAVLMARYGVK
jgi:hypothetical protein